MRGEVADAAGGSPELDLLSQTAKTGGHSFAFKASQQPTPS